VWRLLHRHGNVFDMTIGLFIIASSVSVGVEIQCELEGDASCVNTTRSLEHFFLVVFLLELIIRVLSDGGGVLRSTWFWFDSALVAVGGMSSWVLEPIVMNSVGGDRRIVLDILAQVLVWRIIRLARLARALRLFELDQFHEMWKLANGLVHSLRTVLSACVLILVTVYVFACLGVELVTKNPALLEDPVTAEVIERHFPSLPVTMLTFVQFANADSVAAIYQPLVKRAWYLVFYFGFAWLVITIKLMNLITATIVDTAITQSDADREFEESMRRKKFRGLTPHLNAIFKELLEKAGTNKLSLKNFRSGLETLQEAELDQLPADIRTILLSDQLIEVCEYIDADGSGVIDEQEFIDGIFSLALQSVPIETTQMLQLLRSQSGTLKKILRRMPKMPEAHHREAGESIQETPLH